MNDVINFFLNLAAAVFNWLFSTLLMPAISIGSMILFFMLVYTAIAFLSRWFWGTSEREKFK